MLMISHGIGSIGWLAADHGQGLAGMQGYRVARPDGTEPVLYGQPRWAVNLVDAQGSLLADETPPGGAVGVTAQGYDPAMR